MRTYRESRGNAGLVHNGNLPVDPWIAYVDQCCCVYLSQLSPIVSTNMSLLFSPDKTTWFVEGAAVAGIAKDRANASVINCFMMISFYIKMGWGLIEARSHDNLYIAWPVGIV